MSEIDETTTTSVVTGDDNNTTTNNDDNDINSKYNKLYNSTTFNNDYFIVRHGQSMGNVGKLIVSNPTIACTNYGLSPVGIEQVATISVPSIIKYYSQQTLNYYNGIIIVSSDLLRAKETATIIYNGIVEYNTNEMNTIKIPLYTNTNTNIKQVEEKEEEQQQDDEGMNNNNNNNNGKTTTIIYEERLRERNFGLYDLTSDDNYVKVWENDSKNANHTINNVESVNSVMNRVTSLIDDWDNNYTTTTTNTNSKYMIVCVAHGDVLQILQTACYKQSGTLHRTAVQHLDTATVRQLTLI